MSSKMQKPDKIYIEDLTEALYLCNKIGTEDCSKKSIFKTHIERKLFGRLRTTTALLNFSYLPIATQVAQNIRHQRLQYTFDGQSDCLDFQSVIWRNFSAFLIGGRYATLVSYSHRLHLNRIKKTSAPIRQFFLPRHSYH